MSSTSMDPNPHWEGGVVVRATYQSLLVSPSDFNRAQLKEIVDTLGRDIVILGQQDQLAAVAGGNGGDGEN
ncbi:UNVERIFIED_CONTAM: hypothetical protein HDU68_012800 [Siphonaria sp. JEL0065]|nr:hypothetical protein HDU68_012800 [Siphonaria sp. JEL0065]